MLDQSTTLVFALIVRWLWQLFGLLKTVLPLVWQCQRVQNAISTHHSVGLFCVHRHSGVCGTETAYELAREWSVHQCVGVEPALGGGVSRQNVKKKTKCWPGDQHTTIWQCLTCTQRQAAREIISDPSPSAETRLLSFNTTQSRAVTGLLTEHHTLKRRLYIMGVDKQCLV
jgi:hypothetical protein